MAKLSFTTTNWGPWFATPNQLAAELVQSIERTFQLVGESDVVAENLTPTRYHAELDTGGVVDVSGSGLDTDQQIIAGMTYSDPSGNSAALVGNLKVDIDQGTVSGALADFRFRFSGLEMAAAGTFSLDSSGGGSASFSQITYKQSGWTMQAGGDVIYSGLGAKGILNHLTATSPQGDSFALSDSVKLTAPILNGIQGTGKGMGFFLSESFLDGHDRMTGGDGNDQFSGYAGDDVLLGSGGNDTLAGGAGNDMLDGGAGTDFAVFSGPRGQYTVTNSSGSFAVRDNPGSEGVDTLASIERLKFSDESVALDVANGPTGTTAKILGVVFGPSAVANKTFVGIGLALLDGGMSYPDLMLTALTAKLGSNFSNTAVVDLLYQNLFGHAPTSTDSAFWSSAIDAGQFSQASLAIAAAELGINAGNIDLVGLTQTGLEYRPFL